MGVLSALKVLELNEKYNLVEGLSEREQLNPEGVELELRVGKVERIVGGNNFLGVEKRASPRTQEMISTYKSDDINQTGSNRWIRMQPGDYFLVSTIEKINIPAQRIKIDDEFTPCYLQPDIRPRTSLQRSGITLYSSVTNPGYSGNLVFGLKNDGPEPFDFELGARMFKILFLQVIGESGRAYSGQHQNGRTTSQGKTEVQN